MTYIKVYKTMIDGNLRFGNYSNYQLLLLIFEKGKESKIINDMINKFAEEDKREFYGTKD